MNPKFVFTLQKVLGKYRLKLGFIILSLLFIYILFCFRTNQFVKIMLLAGKISTQPKTDLMIAAD